MSEGSDEGGEVVGGVEDDEESKRYERSLGEYVEGLDVNMDETGLLEPSPTGTK